MINMKEVELDSSVDVDRLSQLTDGYSGADVANVCRDASMMSIRRLMDEAREQGLRGEGMQKLLMQQQDLLASAVTQEDFEIALSKISPSVSEVDLEKYQEWMDTFGST